MTVDKLRTELEPLLARLSDEADLCRNDGANDIAALLDDARAGVQSLLLRIDGLEERVVELWHESEAARGELHEYLNMTPEQYAAWVSK